MKEIISSSREAIDVLLGISDLLNTGLSKSELVVCVKLCEAGINPEALAMVIKELKREALAVKIFNCEELLFAESLNKELRKARKTDDRFLPRVASERDEIAK